MLGVGYQVHNLSELDPGLGDENMWRVVAGYTLGDFRIVGLYQKEDDLNRLTADGAGGYSAILSNSLDRTVWGLGGAYKMGNMTFKAQYYNSDEVGNLANTDADMWAVGMDYSLSKRTTVQFAYASADNESAASRTPFGGGHGDNPSTVAGGNPTGFGVNLKHAF
jgi:predicted porin